MKQLEPNPYEALTQKYPAGTVVRGRVRNIADFGIFVEIEEGIDGLVHISDMSWTQRIKHPSELYQKGDEVEAVVLHIDTTDGDKPKISLGIKQLIGRSLGPHSLRLPGGQDRRAPRCRRCSTSVPSWSSRRASRVWSTSPRSPTSAWRIRAQVLKPGQDVKVQIITVDAAERKIGLSMKAAAMADGIADAQGYSGGTPGATLGDVMRDKLKGLAAKAVPKGEE